MAKRQLVLMSRGAGEEGEDGAESLGSLEAVIRVLKRFNCWADGSGFSLPNVAVITRISPGST